jgi:transcriptional regulator with XRE-family HTH domain
MFANLKLQIWKAGLRQNRLAQMVGIDETLLSRILNGFRQPGPDLKRRIAAVLQVDEEWLFAPSRTTEDMPAGKQEAPSEHAKRILP